MLSCSLLILATIILSIIASDVVILTSKNFESLTQASTGSTTGDWLVEFYAPWCGHCKKLEPIYDQVAEQLKGEVNVAKVDVTANRDIGTRFEIKGFPTIKFLSKGKVYTFKGRRSVEEIVEFVRNGYQVHSPEEVAPPLGVMGEIGYIYKHAYKQAVADMKRGKFFTVDMFLTFLPLIFVLLILLLVCLPSPSSNPPKRRHFKDATAGAGAAGEGQQGQEGEQEGEGEEGDEQEGEDEGDADADNNNNSNNNNETRKKNE